MSSAMLTKQNVSLSFKRFQKIYVFLCSHLIILRPDSFLGTCIIAVQFPVFYLRLFCCHRLEKVWWLFIAKQKNKPQQEKERWTQRRIYNLWKEWIGLQPNQSKLCNGRLSEMTTKSLKSDQMLLSVYLHVRITERVWKLIRSLV